MTGLLPLANRVQAEELHVSQAVLISVQFLHLEFGVSQKLVALHWVRLISQLFPICEEFVQTLHEVESVHILHPGGQATLI